MVLDLNKGISWKVLNSITVMYFRIVINAFLGSDAEIAIIN